LQPDVGRTGISDGREIASLAEALHVSVALRISIGLGPQIAAAPYLAAAFSNLTLTECNPLVYRVAKPFL